MKLEYWPRGRKPRREHAVRVWVRGSLWGLIPLAIWTAIAPFAAKRFNPSIHVPLDAPLHPQVWITTSGMYVAYRLAMLAWVFVSYRKQIDAWNEKSHKRRARGSLL